MKNPEILEKLPKELDFICAKCECIDYLTFRNPPKFKCAFQSMDNDYCPQLRQVIALYRGANKQ